MLLRVRGRGASYENSQATLMFLRGFRLTNTGPATGECIVSGVARPLRYSHFYVNIQTSTIGGVTENGNEICQTTWKELWNLYDIVYNELHLFPDCGESACLFFSFSGSKGEEDMVKTPGFTSLTARNGSEKAVVVTHFFSSNDIQSVTENQTHLFRTKTAARIVVLDLSDVPLAEAPVKIAAEMAWLAAYSSMCGTLGTVTHVIVRLPFVCETSILSRGLCRPVVQEGLDFIAEHIALLVDSFRCCAGDDAIGPVDISFIPSTGLVLRETLASLCMTGEAKQREKGIFVFIGDHRKRQEDELLGSIASLLNTDISLVLVPLRGFLDGDEKQCDMATRRENQVVNFCPCCGHSGDH